MSVITDWHPGSKCQTLCMSRLSWSTGQIECSTHDRSTSTCPSDNQWWSGPDKSPGAVEPTTWMEWQHRLIKVTLDVDMIARSEDHKSCTKGFPKQPRQGNAKGKARTRASQNHWENRYLLRSVETLLPEERRLSQGGQNQTQ